MLARLLILLALLMSAPASAESLEGSWALQLDGATIFRFDIDRGTNGEWHGTWSKPSSFASDGDHFQRLTGPVKKVQSMAGIDADDGVELSFNDPRPGAIPDIFLFRQIDPDAVQMTYVGTNLAPYLLERVGHDTSLGPWDADRTYSRKGATDATAPEAPAKEPATPPPVDPNTFELPPGAPVGR